MKNFIGLIITIILIITAITAAIIIHNNSNQHFKEVTIDDYLKETENKMDKLIYINNSKYQNDDEFKTMIKLIAEENDLTIYHIDTNGISNSEYTKVLNVVVLENSPTLAIIKENEVVVKIDDLEKTKDEIETTLKENDFIQKDD